MSSTLGEPAPVRSVAPADLVGRTVLQFRVVERLGEGGMGVVYRAFDDKLRRDVALKVLSARYLADERNKELIFREARAAAALTHPNIAAIYDVHDVDGVTFLAMELVDGETLRARLGRGRIPLADAIAIAREIAAGLARAHHRGVVHRDLKPDNVMLTRDGHVKLLDFGLAKSVGEAEPIASGDASPALAATVPASSDATRAGRVMGTPAYMSPEQSRAEPVDARTDVFAFGAVLYEMVSGTAPFVRSSSDPAEWRWTPKQPLRRPRALATVVARCLAVDPASRFANGAALVITLTHVGRRSRWPVLAVLPVAAGVAWWLWPSQQPAPTWSVEEHEVTGYAPDNYYTTLLPNGNVAYATSDGVLWEQSLSQPDRSRRFAGVDLERPVSVAGLANGDIGLHTAGALWRISPGRPPLRLRDAPPTWDTAMLSPDGSRIAIADGSTPMHVRVVPVMPVDAPEQDVGAANLFEWAPRGDALAMVTRTRGGRQVEVRSLTGRPPIVVATDDRLISRNDSAGMAWLSPTQLAYVLQPGSGHPDAELFVAQIGEDTSVSVRVATWPGADVITFGAANGGLLLERRRTKDDVFVGTFASDGTLEAHKSTTTAANELPVGWMPDGRMLLLSDRTGRRELYTRQADTDTRLLADPVSVIGPPSVCRDGSVWLWMDDATGPTLARVAAGMHTAERFYAADPANPRKLAARADVQCVGDRNLACESLGEDARFSFVDARGLRDRTLATVHGTCNQWWTPTPDGRSIVHGNARDPVATIDLASGTVTFTPVLGLQQTPAFGPDGRLLWSGFDDNGKPSVIEARDGKLATVWPPASAERVFWLGGLAISGRQVMFLVRTSTVSVWWVTPHSSV